MGAVDGGSEWGTLDGDVSTHFRKLRHEARRLWLKENMSQRCLGAL